MNARGLIFSILFGLLAMSAAIADNHQATGESASDPAMEMMKRMQERTALTEHHENLRQYVGKYDLDIKMWLPGAPPISSKGSAEISWAIKDRWLVNRAKGVMMGQSYESFSLHGYDSYAKNNVSATVSSMDNSLNVTRGVIVDPTGKLAVEYGTLNEYLTDELNKPLKTVFRSITEDQFVLEIWDLGVGEAGIKVVEYTYNRVK